MDGIINKGLSITLVLIFLPVALLVMGELGRGTVQADGTSSSFWFGINSLGKQ